MALPIIIYIVVTLTVIGGSFLVSAYLRPEERQVRRRLAREFREVEKDESPYQLYKRPDQISLDTEPGEDSHEELRGGSMLSRGTGQGRLVRLLARANCSLSPFHFILGTIALACLLTAAGFFLGGWLLAALAAIAGGMLPFVYLKQKARQRREKYLKQLPAAFELMARVIRAGQSVPQALQAVGEAFEDPLAAEFNHCQMQLGLGLRPEIVFRELAQRSGLVDLRIFVMAILIQQKTGGNLSDVLDRLAGMIRARLKLRNQVKTLTAEGRLQGWTLLVLPFVVFGAMMAINRQYAETLLENQTLLLITGLAMLVGVVWIRRIVTFEY